MSKKLFFLLIPMMLFGLPNTGNTSHVKWGHSPDVKSIPAHASGEFELMPDTSSIQGDGKIQRFYLEKEIGISKYSDQFEKYVEEALFNSKGWISAENISLQRINDRSGDFGITLATPETVDELCKPLDTNGIYSCWNSNRVVINLWRWHAGDEDFDKLRNYRIYVINHEVGHALDFDHKICRKPDELASIMVPQSKELGNCQSNPWPFPKKK